ncbi:MAG: VWA domain-containing protein [Xanthomonadaceae bacterium]|nr:VWA domain-containing protein [Xanthomonadaceae bacterium]
MANAVYWHGVFDDFAWPWAWLILPLPWLVKWVLPPRRSEAAALRVPYGPQWKALMGIGGHSFSRRMRVLPWLVWILLCTAIARPQQLGDKVELPQQGRQMMLAVDLSGSMSEPDMELGGRVVDRLTAAKAVLADFLERRTGDRIGLLVFGERAYVLTPLTLDHDSVRDQLRDSVVGLAGRDTALGDAIGLSVKRLREQPEGERVLILLTDGVNNAGVLEPMKAAELAKAEHVRVYTIAFGGNASNSIFSLLGVRIPVNDESIDEATLQQIAEATGGRFFRARDTRELVAIYNELNHLEPVKAKDLSMRPKIERYHWPLALALGLLLLGFLWPRKTA